MNIIEKAVHDEADENRAVDDEANEARPEGYPEFVFYGGAQYHGEHESLAQQESQRKDGDLVVAEAWVVERTGFSVNSAFDNSVVEAEIDFLSQRMF